MSIVSCGSCGTQYNAAGYQPGVQFKCTQCGAMVQVPAAGPRPTRGVGRPTAGRPAGARPPARGYGAPAKSGGNTGLIVGLVLGLGAVGAIIAIVVMSSGPSPQQSEADRLKAEAERINAERAQRDKEVAARNDAMRRTLNAALTRGAPIETALRNKDRASLDNMFDWNIYSSYVRELAAKDAAFLVSPMFSTGDWAKDDNGKLTGLWAPTSVHTSETLRKQVLDYIEKFFFGSPDVHWSRERTDTNEGRFANLTIGGQTYMGRRIYVDLSGAGKTKEFWVGAPEGSEAVRVINFVDPSALHNLKQDAGAGQQGNTVYDQNPMRDPRRDPRDPDNGEEAPPEIELPPLAKTNAKPADPRLANILRDVSRGEKLLEAQRRTIAGAAAADKKGMLGALIDALIDAHAGGKRREKAVISAALLEVWRGFAAHAGFQENEMIYEVDGMAQTESPDPIRRWILVYNKYEA